MKINWCKWLNHAWKEFSLYKTPEKEIRNFSCARCSRRKRITKYSNVLKEDKLEIFEETIKEGF